MAVRGTSALAEGTAAPKGRPRLAMRSPDETKERLIAAASDEFAARGYADSSIRNIAIRAGVTSGTIYCHFANKADLLIAALKREVAVQPLAGAPDEGRPTSAAGLGALIARYAQRELARARKLSVELHAASLREAAVADIHATFNRSSHAGLCALIEAGKSRGGIAGNLPTTYTAHLFHTLILGLSHLETLEPALIGGKEWTKFLEDSVIRLLCCDHSPEGE